MTVAMDPVRQAFAEAQHSLTTHKKLSDVMWKQYVASREKTYDTMLDCIKRFLVVFKRESAVERLVQFVCRICFLFNEKEADKDVETDDWFATTLLRFLLCASGSAEKSVRFRSCQLIAGVMKSFDENADLPEEVWDTLEEAMMARLEDSVPAVRAQAISAISRLQNPEDKADPVMTTMLELLETDSSKEVRKAILTVLAITKESLPAILMRTRDEKDDVRRHAYNVLACKVNPRQLTIEERCKLVLRGRRDRIASVKKAVNDMLIKKWFNERAQGDLSLYIDLFDIELFENETTEAIDAILTSKPEIALEFVKGEWWGPSASEIQLFIARHCLSALDRRNESITEYLPSLDNAQQSLIECVEIEHFTKAIQIEKVVHCLKELLYPQRPTAEMTDDLLTSATAVFAQACPTREDKHKALCTLETCMEQMKGMTNGEDAELYFIDAKSRYFSVAAAFLAASKKEDLSLFKDLILPLVIIDLKNPNQLLRMEALRALGQIMILDEREATTYVSVMRSVVSLDVAEVQKLCLQILFDCLAAYPTLGGNVDVQDGDAVSLVSFLQSFLLGDDEDLQAIAVQGFAKLLVNGMICESNTIATLAILLYSPATEECNGVRQALTVFFQFLGDEKTSKPDSPYLPLKRTALQAISQCIRTIRYAPRSSPVARISPFHMVIFFASLFPNDEAMHALLAKLVTLELFVESDSPVAKALVRALASPSLLAAGEGTGVTAALLEEMERNSAGQDKAFMNHLKKAANRFRSAAVAAGDLVEISDVLEEARSFKKQREQEIQETFGGNIATTENKVTSSKTKTGARSTKVAGARSTTKAAKLLSEEESSDDEEEEEEEEEEECEVEKVLAARKKKGVLQYRLQWRGYPEEEATWVNAEDCDCDQLIEEFLRGAK